MEHGSELMEVIDLENRRIAAVNECDWNALQSLLADDFVQIHAHGQIDTKYTLIEGLKGKGSMVKRDSPSVRIYGDVAVLTGEVVHTVQLTGQSRVFHIFATQVAVKHHGEWRFVSAQATQLPHPK